MPPHPLYIIGAALTFTAALTGLCLYVGPDEPLPCVTHVPDPERGASYQCQRGARIEVVDHVALCVCPESKR